MRTIFAKVLLWSLGTFALSLVAYWAISRTLERRGPPGGNPIHRVIDLVQDDAFRAYEEGGAERLSAYLQRVSSYLPGEHVLTDSRGYDLVNGADRSDLLRRGRGAPESRRLSNGCFIHVAPTRDSKYRFISISKPWFEPPNILPYYGAIVLVIAGMGAILAVHLAGPLRACARRSTASAGAICRRGSIRSGRTRSASCHNPSTRWLDASRLSWWPSAGYCWTSLTSSAHP